MIKNLIKWIPYNVFIGDTDCIDTHLVKVIEEWYPINDYIGYYEVSSFGRVKANKRVIDKTHKNGLKYTATLQECLKICTRGDGGYIKVKLHKLKSESTVLVHRLVCEAFHNNIENKPMVNHIDFDKTNNKYFNLEWCTGQENAHHTVINGRHVSVPSKIRKINSNEDILKIRKLRKETTMSLSQLATMFNVSKGIIYTVVNNFGYNEVVE